MDTVSIVGENYFGAWRYTRTACRGIVRRDGDILLCFETRTGQYMIPGGGMEPGEDAAGCCAREVAEETGLLVRPGRCVLRIEEFYEDWRYVSLYFPCETLGRTEPRLTEQEAGVGMEPRWVPLRSALEIFSRHADYAATDEMRRGLYLRGYTALRRLFPDLP